MPHESSRIRSLWRLKRFTRAHAGLLLGGIVCFFVARLFEALVPLYLAEGIDRIGAGNLDVTWPVLAIIGAVCVRFFVVSLARYLVRQAGLRIAFDMRQQLFASLQLQGTQFFNRYGVGDMMTRAVADLSLIQRLFSMGTILFVILFFATIVGFSFMISLSLELTLLILPPMPFVFAYTWYASRQMGLTSVAVQQRMSAMAAQVQENLSGIRTVQAMAQESNEIRRFAATNQSYASAFYDQARINSLMTSVSPSLVAICSITILGYGSNMVLEGKITIGTLTAFFFYVNMVVQPFRVAGMIVNLFQRGAVATDRLFEVIERTPEHPDQPQPDAPSQISGDIDLRQFSMRYPDANANALSDIDLAINTGETVAIMGRVGSGKTTLLRALVRLIEPNKNSVFIDNRDLFDYPLATLRSQIALVPQDAFLFGEALQGNITYDDPSRSLDQIWQAADAADLRTTIESFPDGMDTLVGERGVTLSGGQKQRTTLARGLIRNAPVLLLDDCFASVDTATEEHILRHLSELRRGQTTLMVSHRVSTARHADRIIVLDEGRIIEQGSHADLLKAGGVYADLERIQREGVEES